MLKKWLAEFDEAYASIEKYKTTDTETYNRLYEAILLESLSYRYLLIDFFPEECGNETELYEMKSAWKTDAARLGITHRSESETISKLYEAWGI